MRLLLFTRLQILLLLKVSLLCIEGQYYLKTIAGTGILTSAGDNSPAILASVYNLRGVRTVQGMFTLVKGMALKCERLIH